MAAAVRPPSFSSAATACTTSPLHCNNSSNFSATTARVHFLRSEPVTATTPESTNHGSTATTVRSTMKQQRTHHQHLHHTCTSRFPIAAGQPANAPVTTNEHHRCHNHHYCELPSRLHPPYHPPRHRSRTWTSTASALYSSTQICTSITMSARKCNSNAVSHHSRNIITYTSAQS